MPHAIDVVIMVKLKQYSAVCASSFRDAMWCSMSLKILLSHLI